LAKKVKILQYDFGLCTEFGARMARDGHEVYYFVPWENAFPKSSLAIIGEGLEGLTRILNFWDYVDQVDMICCFDTFFVDVADYLWRHGYKVFAAGKAEILENNRWKTKQIMKAVNLPLQPVRLIKGFETLRDYLKNNKNKAVKLNTFRGDIETFIHREYDTTQAQFLGDIERNVGAKANKLEFIVEDLVGDIEPGYDGFVIDGQYPNWGMYGYEVKGNGYIGKVTPYNQIPKAIREVNDKLAPVFKKLSPTRTFFSTEVRVDKSGKGYLIDPTVRAPLPNPSAVHLEIWENLSDFILNGAVGKLIPLKPVAKYGAAISFESEWAEEHWTEIPINPEVRRWIKLRMACRIDGKYYALPGFTSLGSIVGLGNTLDEAIDNVKRNLEKSGIEKIKEVVCNLSELEDVKKQIEQGKKYGIPF
jgi:hypothetical protein